ncbi:MAG: FAD-linked oxidase C-terminal domain-containing protein [Desulfatibacillaceae bacterium]|nr:FAD-linked oxidase C-terminal domain-containing protein [Desulfatibacillaceae bacterium]
MGSSSLGRDLEGITGAGSVLVNPADLYAYRSDATYDYATGAPDAVVLPQTTEQVAAILRYASGRGIFVTPRGAGSGLSGGCTPIMGGIVVDLKRMNRILGVNPGNMTATVEAGVVLDKFKAAIAPEGLFYPPDPQSASVCTIGGNVATRAGGPRGVKYGTTPHFVLGLTAALPDGAVIRPGSLCVKQSVGYDITHLFAGSEGTLGIITQVHLRLLPMPKARATAVVTCNSAEQAASVVSAIISAGTVPAMLEFLTAMAVMVMNSTISPPLAGDGQAYLLMEIDGSPEQVAADIQTLSALCKKLGVMGVRVIEDQKEAASYWKARASLYPFILTMAKKMVIEDVTVPRNQLPEFVKRIGELSARLGILIGLGGHAGDGNMHPSLLFSEVDESTRHKAEQAVEQIVRMGLALGGTISGEHGIGLHKSAFVEWELGREQIALMKRIKAAFDPDGIMNPGKIWPVEAGTEGQKA